MNSKLLLDRSLSAVENHTGPEDLMEIDVRIKLGEFYLSNKEYIKAEGAFQKVLTILESAENPHNDRAAIALNNLAKLYIDQGRYSEAQPLCHRALSLLESNYQNHPSVADVLAVLIQLHHQTGDTIEEAKCKQRLEDIHMQQQATSASVATAME